jgi:hypothetical protein
MNNSSDISDQSNVITVVSGLPRSGTSMMMKMLEAGGLDVLVDNIRTPDADNPLGYYEFEAVKTLQKGNTEWLDKAQGKVVKIIATLIPYLPETYQYRIVFMRRALTEIMASQLKMLSNRGEKHDSINVEMMTNVYQKHLKQVDLWVNKQANVQRIEISYNDLLSSPRPLIAQINEFFGGDLDIKRMQNVINPNLYRQRIAGHKKFDKET